MKNKTKIKYNYIPYYLITIQDNEIGFKPVRGATGLGKTYGLIKAIKESHQENNNKRKYIYTTNRHALIKEVKSDLEKEKIKNIYLRSDKEVLKDLLDDKEDSLENTLMSLIEIGFFQYHSQYKNDKAAKKEIQKRLKNIESAKYLILINERDNDEATQNFLEEQLVSLSRLLKSQFYLRKKKESKKKYQEFLKHPIVWKLFPYIEFENNPEATVLLATIQKLSYGFFDGHKKRKLPSLKKNIIFLDEFDFLESEILSVLAQETPLNNPLEFVKIFYDRYKMIKSSKYLEKEGLSKVKTGLDEAHNELKKEIKEKNIHFPKLTDFTYSSAKEDKSLVLFHNKKTVFSEDFYLRQTPYSWQITKLKSYKNTIHPLHLFIAIKKCVKKLLDTFSRTMQEQKEEVDYIINKIWNVKNDNEQGQNQKYITSTSLFKNIQVPNAEVKESEFDYLHGFNVIELYKDKDNTFDPLDVKLDQIELPTSPEAIIRKLSYENLVFALSATSDIPRVVNSFDEKWLKDNTLFIEPSQADKELLLNMKKEKDNVRKSKIKFYRNKPISSSHKKEVEEALKCINNSTIFFDDKDKSVSDAVKEKRMERVRKVIGCIDWILNKSKNRSHLIFLTTFKHFRWLLDNENIEVLEEVDRELLSEIWQTEKKQDKENKVTTFRLSWEGKTCNIVFLSSESAKRIEEYGKEFYNKQMADTEVDKVILITQYATASNGVNLGFEDKEGIKKDFESIHLLESKHFWITKESDTKAKKEKFWYLWKIHKNGELSKKDFKYFLGHTDGGKINDKYKKTHEHTLNAMALFHQALGRVERQRTYEQPLIEISLSQEQK